MRRSSVKEGRCIDLQPNQATQTTASTGTAAQGTTRGRRGLRLFPAWPSRLPSLPPSPVRRGSCSPSVCSRLATAGTSPGSALCRDQDHGWELHVHAIGGGRQERHPWADDLWPREPREASPLSPPAPQPPCSERRREERAAAWGREDGKSMSSLCRGASWPRLDLNAAGARCTERGEGEAMHECCPRDRARRW
jgi:hypothetical protein